MAKMKASEASKVGELVAKGVGEAVRRRAKGRLDAYERSELARLSRNEEWLRAHLALAVEGGAGGAFGERADGTLGMLPPSDWGPEVWANLKTVETHEDGSVRRLTFTDCRIAAARVIAFLNEQEGARPAVAGGRGATAASVVEAVLEGADGVH